MPANLAHLAARHTALEDLIREGRAMLAGLPATDGRASLLGLALRRRDGALIEGILAELKKRSLPPP